MRRPRQRKEGRRMEEREEGEASLRRCRVMVTGLPVSVCVARDGGGKGGCDARNHGSIRQCRPF